MFIRRLKDCKKIISGDKAALREILRPHKRNLKFRYSLAHARVLPGRRTLAHRLKSSEVYYILEGSGLMHIGKESAKVRKGDTVYIPPHQTQYISNTGRKDLVFLCIVDPAWKAEDERIE
jgi:mannose-6-phosphate isomerase-like protein (cupin superfamily)